MTLPTIRVLADALANPAILTQLRPREWDLLVRQARKADVLAAIASNADRVGVLEQLPAQPLVHLRSALKLASRQRREVRAEVQHIRDALARTNVPFVLLKGAAYALCDLCAADGRMMSDIDILVPREALNDVESALMLRGWSSSEVDAYDQRYYRQWMHELPPMQHIFRGTALDVHHAILPLTARVHPSSAMLLASARPLNAGDELLRVLAPVDMVLHSATHLFHEGELEHGLRGLVDIDRLLREFADTQPGFWASLVPRAEALELTRPLGYALRYAHLLLGTPIPHTVIDEVARTPGALPAGFGSALMDFLYARALRPAHATSSDRWSAMAHGMLYVRAHWLRMPPGMLALHLGRKLVVRSKPQEPKEEV